MELQIELPEIAGLLRNTCSITMLQGSNKINVIPPEAQAQVDCRLLPDQDREAFLREFAAALNDPSINVETIIGFTAAVSSTDSPLYARSSTSCAGTIRRRASRRRCRRDSRTATGSATSGSRATGSRRFVIPAADEGGVHGNNERISIDNIRKGTAMMVELVKGVAGTKPVP